MTPHLIGPFETRLLALERRQAYIDDILRAAKIQALGVQQGLWDDSSQRVFRVITPPGPPAANTTVNGLVRGCGSLGLPGATVVINTAGSSTGTTTVMTDGSGNYSGMIYLASNQTINISITPASARQTGLTFTTGTLTAGSTNTAVTKTVGIATGFHCSPLCVLPLADTFDLSDSSVAGNHPMVWGSFGGGGWSVTYNTASAILDATTGVFTYSSLTGALTASNCTPPITFTFTNGSRHWVATNA